jgi:hypothetical protein
VQEETAAGTEASTVSIAHIVDSPVHETARATMADYRRTKNNWTRPSVNRLQSSAALREAAKGGQYKISSPWDQQDEELVEDFDRALQTMNTTVKSPWEEGSTELRAQQRNEAAAAAYKLTTPFDEDPAFVRKQEELRRAASEYKYESLFEVPPLTAKQQKIIDEYKMNPPFRCSYNVVAEEKRTAKKLAPGKNPPTRQPWAHGSLPADPVPYKIFERPPTALWTVPPKQEHLDSALPSSGDPILDNLRAQLRKHGAAGIAGLSRKFRIMDDDQSGTLDMQEFIKGIKECKVADLSDKALKHLFLYFGTSSTLCKFENPVRHVKLFSLCRQGRQRRDQLRRVLSRRAGKYLPSSYFPY